MKTVIKSTSLFLRLGVTVAALLLGQQALAVGTDAGVTVSNQATIGYSVGGTPQTAINSSPDYDPGSGLPTTFLVDRRVDFTLTADGVTDTVAPGDGAQTFDFTLANTSNSTMDFVVTVAQLDPPGTVNTLDDTGAQVPSLVLVTVYVDDLLEDGLTTINVTGDADLTLANGDIANIEVTVTASDPSGTAGAPVALADTSGVPDNRLVVDNVLADDVTTGDGIETAGDGIQVQSAALTIAKSYVVISDPINGVSPNAKAIPGAIIEYTIEIDNSGGAVPATGISISDDILGPSVFRSAANPAPLNFEPYTAGLANIEFGPAGAPTSSCLADGDATDGCTLAGTTLTIAGLTLGSLTPIDVANGATLLVRFRVYIPATP